jgi:hypothetical protein
MFVMTWANIMVLEIRQEAELPEIAPATETSFHLAFSLPGVPLHVKFDILRPTGFSAYSLDWKP